MKRELKFRVWNGMEMIYDITTGKFGSFYVNPEKGDGLNPQDTASLTVNTTKYHDDTPVMQFTGLVDKNGIEIYEGDKIILSGGLRLEYYPDNGEVFFNRHTASFVMKALNSSGVYMNFGLGYNDGTEIEVIGNMYAGVDARTTNTFN